MLAGAVCDFCDGLAARALNAYSPLGKELDSLADLITFGMLPSIMLYKSMDWYHPGQWYCFIPLIIVVFSAIRLAKFNIDERQSENFIGLATPACALWCGSLIFAADHGVNTFAAMLHGTYFIPIVSIVLALLMVSEVPMFSLKFKKGSAYNRIRFSFIAIVAALAVATVILKINWSFIVFLALTCYITLNLLTALFSLRIAKNN
jgi:CDP-diacylglycerol--serine O-phosphatidyltransferase